MTARVPWPHLTRRRQRFWRFVSPRRRGLGLALLAGVLAAFSGYWHLTNDRHVRDEAVRYLEASTGWRVRIGHAKFSLFDGIELKDVRIWDRSEDTPWAMFEGRVHMAHRPLDLASGQFTPTDIFCEGVVRRDQSQLAIGGASGLLPQDAGPAVRRTVPRLPPIRLIGMLYTMDRAASGREPVGKAPLNVSLNWVEGNLYRATTEQPQGGSQSFEIDLATGQVRNLAGSIVQVEDFTQSLPSPYKDFLERYHLRGTQASFRQIGPEEPANQGKHEVRMSGLSLTLPPEQGGLDLTEVEGRLVFDGSGVGLEKVTGRVTQAGGARFEVSGRYGGYAPDSPFDLTIGIKQVRLPRPDQVTTGPAADFAEGVRASYRPEGTFDVSAQVERKRPASDEKAGANRAANDGRHAAPQGLRFHGTVEPQGMKAVYHGFPYAVEDIRGQITFDETRVRFDRVDARRGGTRIRVGGWLALSGRTYDVRTQGEAVVFDDALRQALPRQFKDYWGLVAPAGKVDADVRVYRGDEDPRERVAIEIDYGGAASMMYRDFPYRVDGLRGQVRIENASVAIDLKEGRRGATACAIQGTLTGLDSPIPRTDLEITAQGVPLDRGLLDAFGPAQGKLLTELKASGTARKVTATVRQSDGKPLEYSIAATLSDTSMTLPGLPGEITQAQGQIVIGPGVLNVKGLSGRRGAAAVQVSGTLIPGESRRAMDLRVRARGLELDPSLRDSLPEGGRRMWEQLQPRGKIDVDCSFRQDMPGQTAGQADYEIVLQADDLKLCYADFPYPLEHVRGKAVVRPGRIVLEEFRGRHEAMEVALSGTIRNFGREDQADLSIQARNAPIDDKLFAALPAGVKPLGACIGRTGQCDVDFKRLRLVSSQAASAPASGPAPAPTVRWGVEGSIDFRGAVVDLGFGSQTVTGRLAGSAAFAGAGLDLESQAALGSLQAGGRKVTELAAKISKSAGSDLIHVRDIAGKSMGGRLAGSAEIRLAQPVECGLQMEVNDVRLEELIPPEPKGPAASGPADPAPKDPKKRPNFEGLLAGNIRLKAKIGDVSSRQAVGELWISRAKINQLPILLGMDKVVLVATPGDRAYTEGILRYELKGPVLLFNEIYLTSQGMSVIGSGRLDMKTEALRMSFLARPGASISRMDSLGDLVAREISEIRVTGTLAKPIPRTVPLGSLDTAIRRLNNPSRED